MVDFNLGLMFYKKYYERVTPEIWEKLIKNKKVDDFNTSLNTEILKQKISDYPNYFNDNKNFKKIELSTMYPGLLIGSGYQHEVGFEGEFKIGFYFDHTTGLPVIPGSSIKGVLRSVFPQKDKNDVLNKEKFRYIKAILAERGINEITEDDVEALKLNIFEGVDQDNKRLPVYKRDIFFEAYPYESSNADQKFLSDDYITPHADPLINPNPIKFLKILSDVKFRFRFKLFDLNKRITAEIKKVLFEQIILDIGVGAKTNVGYGQFVEVHQNSEE